MPLNLNCTNEQKVRVYLFPKTASGKSSSLDGPPVVTMISGAATAVVGDGNNDDGSPHQNAAGDNAFAKIDFISDDGVGDTTFEISADADLGEGVETIKDVAALHVSHPNAASFGFSEVEVLSK